MPASVVLPLFFTGAQITAGGLAVSAAAFAIRVVSTLAISSLLTRDQPQITESRGGVVQLPPATNNKLPVVYGDAWVSPIITDVKISEDQQTMWYVLAFSETTDSGTINFDTVYWDDKLLLFDPNNPSEILGWYNPQQSEGPAVVTGIAGKISMYFYNNGSNSLNTLHYCKPLGAEPGSYQPTVESAISILQDPTIAEVNRWTPNHLMSNTVFAVVKVKYDSDYGITGLGQIKARVTNSTKAPGSVMRDYLENSRYGCGIASSNIDLGSLAALDTYAAQATTIAEIDDQGSQVGTYFLNPRYQINGIIDTSNDCLSNLQTITDCADSWVQWNETRGQWSVSINRSLTESGFTTSTMRVITSDQIIGGINVSPLDLNRTFNSINVQFPNKEIRDQFDQRYYEIPNNRRYANEPANQLQVQLPLVNTSTVATYIAYKRLWNSREDININFSMDYSGIQIDAGDIVAVKHEWYGWSQKSYGTRVFPGKPFRVTQVKEQKAPDGFLSVQIAATAYNDDIYTVTNPHTFTQAGFSGVSDPNFIDTPPTPTIPTGFVNTNSNTFVVKGEVPAFGIVRSMEFYYSVQGSTVTNNNYVLYTVQNYSEGPIYPVTDVNGDRFFEQVLFANMPAGTYYFRTRAVGPNNSSELSGASAAFVWENIGVPISGNQILDNTIAGTKVITGDPAKVGTSEGGGFFDTMGPVLTAGLGAAALYQGYKKGWFDFLKPEDEPFFGGGNDAGILDIDPNLWVDWDYDFGYPDIGDTINYFADATPDIGDLDIFANFDDYDIPFFDDFFSAEPLPPQGSSYIKT